MSRAKVKEVIAEGARNLRENVAALNKTPEELAAMPEFWEAIGELLMCTFGDGVKVVDMYARDNERIYVTFKMSELV